MGIHRGSLACVLLFVSLFSLSQSQKVIKLGFLLPYPTGDAAVPVRLADEWISAVRVALDVLGPQYQDQFVVEPFVQNSNCEQAAAKVAAERLVYTGVVGVVGPACSEAVVGAAEVLGPAGIPFVSYAATAEFFREGNNYVTFFRTVFGDDHQAMAVNSVLKVFGWTKMLLFFSNDTYGTPLANSIRSYALAQNIAVTPILVPYPTPSDVTSSFYIDGSLIKTDNNTVVVLATHPYTAELLWKTALNLNCLGYPWWYLGTDGATAFDLVGEGDNVTVLTEYMQGELGLAPYKGNYNPRNSPYIQFLDYWKEQTHENFPGLLTLDVTPRIEHTRAYVPYIIDAVWAYFEAFNNIIAQQGQDVTAALVVSCFYDTPANCVHFNGASGVVAFNKTTGERNGDVQTPEYDLVNLVDITWEEKSAWKEKFVSAFNVDLTEIRRPNTKHVYIAPDAVQGAPVYSAPSGVDAPAPVSSNFSDFAPPPPSTSSTPASTSTTPPASPSSSPSPTSSSTKKSSGGTDGGTIAAIVIIIIIVIAGAGFGIWYWQKRRKYFNPEQQQFVRML